MAVEFGIGHVVDNVDELKQGHIKVLIKNLDPENVFTAKPVYPFMGNEEIKDGDAHIGMFNVPPVGGYVFLIYDPKSLSEIYYLGSVLTYQNKPPLPECNLNEPHKRYVWRSKSGQSIVISESDSDKGLRITGIKHQYNRNSPDNSVLKTKGNQSIINFDGKTNNIHIYSYNDIIIETDGGSITLTKSGDLIVKVKNIKTETNTYDLKFSQWKITGGSINETATASRTKCTCQGLSLNSTFSFTSGFAHKCGKC